jgi:hypothetical protein
VRIFSGPDGQLDEVAGASASADRACGTLFDGTSLPDLLHPAVAQNEAAITAVANLAFRYLKPNVRSDYPCDSIEGKAPDKMPEKRIPLP